MPSTLAHAASASLVAITAAHVRPGESGYVLAALAAASVADLDHLVYLVRDRALYRQLGYRGHLYRARSVVHELPGLLLAGAASALLLVADPTLARLVFIAFAVHLAEDWLIGRSAPFKPVDTTLIQPFPLTFRQKVFTDALILAASGVAWILFLSGRL